MAPLFLPGGLLESVRPSRVRSIEVNLWLRARGCSGRVAALVRRGHPRRARLGPSATNKNGARGIWAFRSCTSRRDGWLVCLLPLRRDRRAPLHPYPRFYRSYTPLSSFHLLLCYIYRCHAVGARAEGQRATAPALCWETLPITREGRATLHN